MGIAILGAVFLGYGLAGNAGAAKGLSDLGPLGGAAFATIFLAAGIGLVITAIFLILMEEKPLRGKSGT